MNVYSQELYHHGILKMRWGQRNGPPYPLTNSQKSHAEKRAESSDSKNEASKEPAKPHVKTAAEMSDDELRDAIQRAELIKKFNELQPKAKKTVIQKGADFVGKQVSKAADNIGGQLATYALGTAVNKLAKKVLNTSENIVNPKKGQKDK